MPPSIAVEVDVHSSLRAVPQPIPRPLSAEGVALEPIEDLQPIRARRSIRLQVEIDDEQLQPLVVVRRHQRQVAVHIVRVDGRIPGSANESSLADDQGPRWIAQAHAVRRCEKKSVKGRYINSGDLLIDRSLDRSTE